MILITITNTYDKPLVTAIDVDNNYERIFSRKFDTDYDTGLAAALLCEAFQYCGRSVRIENKMASRVSVD